MPYVSVGETSLYYEENGEGQPIVFIHPPAMGHITFKKQAALSDTFKVITFDIRGHGRSGFVKGEAISISQIAADIINILNHLDIEKAVICGYSNGGSIALEFALHYPKRVSTIILSGGFPKVNSLLLKQEYVVGMAAAKWKATSFLGTVLAKSHTNSKEFQQEIKNYVQMTDPEILYNLYKEGLNYNCTNRLEEIESPILLIYGTKSNYINKHSKLFIDKHNNTDIVFIPGASHQIPTKYWQEFNNIIENYLLKRGETYLWEKRNIPLHLA